MTIRELCEKEVVQLEQGVCLGRADDLAFDPATARLQSLILLGRPRLFGLLGRDDSLDHSMAGDRRPLARMRCWCTRPCRKHRRSRNSSNGGKSCA